MLLSTESTADDLLYACSLAKILKIFLICNVGFQLLPEVLLAQLAHIELFKLAPAGHTQPAEILGRIDVDLHGRVETLKEAALTLVNLVSESVLNEFYLWEGDSHSSNCLRFLSSFSIVGHVSRQGVKFFFFLVFFFGNYLEL